MFKVLNLAIRFILELILLFSIGYWGFHFGSGLVAQVVLGIGLPLLAAVIWGMTISPKARIKLPLAVVLLIEFLIFATAVACQVSSGLITFAIVFAFVALVNRLIVIKWRMQP
ncbi:YrdB family protein [Paenibacillus lautus]|uniref:YrdB family protein n=1 Tax=Paenibacillus lautus TaxID=1401 RepID=UPI003D271691